MESPNDAGIAGLTHVTVLVDDQDDALDFYTDKLGFEKRADEQFGEGARWVTVAPGPGADVEVVLQEPTPEFHGDRAETLRARVGEGTTWVLETDDCRATCEQLQARGVTVTSPPEEVPWGVSAVVEDLYGNPYNLLEPR